MIEVRAYSLKKIVCCLLGYVVAVCLRRLGHSQRRGETRAWPQSGEWPAWGEGVGTWLCPRKFTANLEGKWGVTTVGTNL